MKLLLASAAFMVISAASSAAAAEKLIFPEDFEAQTRMRCEGRRTRTWCTNDYQPQTGDCEWDRGNCRVKQTGKSCEDRSRRGWCLARYGGITCDWSRGRCRAVDDDTPSPTPAPTPSDYECTRRTRRGWCESGSRGVQCQWAHRRQECVMDRSVGDVCDGVATSRKQDCKNYCQSGSGSNSRRYGYSWSYDSDEYKCTCNNGRVCVTPRYEENGEDEVEVSEDYFDSNSADFFEEE